jgi:hypothetical protein
MALLLRQQRPAYRLKQLQRRLQRIKPPFLPSFLPSPYSSLLTMQNRSPLTYNATAYYTIFALPIAITSSIPASDGLPSCNVLSNTLLSQAELDASVDTIPPSGYPWVDGNGAQTLVPDSGGTSMGVGSASSSSGVSMVVEGVVVVAVVRRAGRQMGGVAWRRARKRVGVGVGVGAGALSVAAEQQCSSAADLISATRSRMRLLRTD